MRPNRWLLIDRAEPFGAKNLSGNEITMTNLRLVLLATNALTALQIASVPSKAPSDSIVVAQATNPEAEKSKRPDKGPPPAAAPARPAAPPPAAAPPKPAAPPPPPPAA